MNEQNIRVALLAIVAAVALALTGAAALAVHSAAAARNEAASEKYQLVEAAVMGTPELVPAPHRNTPAKLRVTLDAPETNARQVFFSASEDLSAGDTVPVWVERSTRDIQALDNGALADRSPDGPSWGDAAVAWLFGLLAAAVATYLAALAEWPYAAAAELARTRNRRRARRRPVPARGPIRNN